MSKTNTAPEPYLTRLPRRPQRLLEAAREVYRDVVEKNGLTSTTLIELGAAIKEAEGIHDPR